MGSRDVLALRHQWSEDGIHGLGFGEDDAESGHQITEPVGAGGKDMSAPRQIGEDARLPSPRARRQEGEALGRLDKAVLELDVIAIAVYAEAQRAALRASLPLALACMTTGA